MGGGKVRREIISSASYTNMAALVVLSLNNRTILAFSAIIHLRHILIYNIPIDEHEFIELGLTSC